MNIWMRVSRDKYQLPEVVADSIEELAEKCNVLVSSIRVMMSRAKHGRAPERYIKVTVSDEEASNIIWGVDMAIDWNCEIPAEDARLYHAVCTMREINKGDRKDDKR